MKSKNLFLVFLLLLAIATVAVSCNEVPEKHESRIELFLTVDETTIEATAEGGTYFIAVSSNSNWTAVVKGEADVASWCTLTYGNDTITVSIAENPLDTMRSAKIKITLDDFTKFVTINQEAQEPFEFVSLEGTHWKLIGSVDTETGDLTEFEPKTCKSCFRITFGFRFTPGTPFIEPSPGRVAGWGAINRLGGSYEVNYATKSINIRIGQGTDAGTIFDEQPYVDTLNSVDSFSLDDTAYPRILRLYYNDGKNYLKHKEIEE